MPRLQRSVIDHTSSEGRRMVMAAQPWVVAGGRTTWIRSPPGNEADRSGEDSSMRWRVEFATSLASRRHQSNVANGNGSRCQPEPVSMKASWGRLIQTSVTSGLDSSGSSERSVKRKADTSIRDFGGEDAAAVDSDGLE